MAEEMSTLIIEDVAEGPKPGKNRDSGYVFLSASVVDLAKSGQVWRLELLIGSRGVVGPLPVQGAPNAAFWNGLEEWIETSRYRLDGNPVIRFERIECLNHPERPIPAESFERVKDILVSVFSCNTRRRVSNYDDGNIPA